MKIDIVYDSYDLNPNMKLVVFIMLALLLKEFKDFYYVQNLFTLFLSTVTYFVTYGTAIACYAYFVLTRQDYLLPDVRDRQYLLNFHKRARKSEWDISKYNSLKEGICRAEVELSKLKDHTKLRLLDAYSRL